MKKTLYFVVLIVLVSCGGEEFPRSYTFTGTEPIQTAMVTGVSGGISTIDQTFSPYFSDPLGFVESLELENGIEAITIISETEISFLNIDLEETFLPYKKQGSQLLTDPFWLSESGNQLIINGCLAVFSQPSRSPPYFGIEEDYCPILTFPEEQVKSIFQEQGMTNGDTLSYTLFNYVFELK